MKRLLRVRVQVRVAAVCALLVLMAGTATMAATAFAASGACGGDVHCVITFGDARIAERQAALTKLSKEIDQRAKTKHISTDQANALQADVTTNETGLTNLKTQLDAETDVTKARQDVKNIYVQFRIFAVVLPRDYRTLELDVEINTMQKLKDLEAKLKKAVDGAPADVKDQVTNLYNDYVNQVADAEAKIDAGQTVLPQLTPENYNTNESGLKTAMTNLHNDIHDASKDLHQAGTDLHQIRDLLKDKTKTQSTGTATATP